MLPVVTPEVFENANVNFDHDIKLYGSDQVLSRMGQVIDIENPLISQTIYRTYQFAADKYGPDAAMSVLGGMVALYHLLKRQDELDAFKKLME